MKCSTEKGVILNNYDGSGNIICLECLLIEWEQYKEPGEKPKELYVEVI